MLKTLTQNIDTVNLNLNTNEIKIKQVFEPQYFRVDLTVLLNSNRLVVSIVCQWNLFVKISHGEGSRWTIRVTCPPTLKGICKQICKKKSLFLWEIINGRVL